MKASLMLAGCIVLVVVRVCSPQTVPNNSPPIPNNVPQGAVSIYYAIKTNVTFRNTTIDAMDYSCGANAFCDASLANFPNAFCFTCQKCHCDDVCTLYGDCCVDRLFEVDTDSPTPPSSQITCQRQHPRSKEHKNPYVFMVTSCPQDSLADQLTRRRCERPSDSTVKESTPVSVLTTQITYRNSYCASCHGQMDFVEWRHEVSCSQGDVLRTAKDKDDLWSLVIASPHCKVKSSPPSGVHTRECLDGLIGKCNITGRWETRNDRIETLCNMYTRPVQATISRYKNIFCSLCNGEKMSRHVHCSDSNVVFPNLVTSPLSVIIDFNPKPRLMSGVPELAQVDTPKCNDSQIYDPLSESCRKVQCPYGRVWSGGRCELILDSVAGVGYSASLAIKFTEELTSAEWNDLVEDFVNGDLRQNLQQFSPFMFTMVSRSLYVTPPRLEGIFITSAQTSGARIDFRFVSISSGYIQQLEDALKGVHSLELTNYTVGEKRGTLSSFPLPCASRISDVLPGIPGDTGLFRDPPFPACEFGSCDFSSLTYEPVLHILNCPHLEFNLTDHNIKLDLKKASMEIDNNTIDLQESDYWACGDTIKFCSRGLSQIATQMVKNRATKEKTSVVSVSLALTIVSVVCIALSLLCLLLTFLVYCLLPQLRTLPGKNTMVLVAYLFCAQLFFQVGINLTYSKNLCRAMGVLIHYFWIVTFMIMGTCAFHMYTVFTNMSAKPFHNTLRETKKVIRYIIISNVLAMLVVGVCIAYHAGSTGGEDIGYGGKTCFLKGPLDIGIFFAGPLGIVLVFNTFCFIRVVLSIRNAPNMKSSKNQTNRNHVTVYLRLSILLGFTWIFGLVAASLQVEVLWYIFVILNGLQGVFIFIAYCLNKRILDMLKTVCCGKTSDKYNSTPVNSPVASTETSTL
ncbi:uncharacterized protein LOC135467772 [Liolophura sinensis]|uniref:uncharacterized protein LOC135467772 n=1 Tax=Liolophura sinensis TaxID=3198878 RepID=UPI0031583C8F